jgi:hypothetical protein
MNEQNSVSREIITKIKLNHTAMKVRKIFIGLIAVAGLTVVFFTQSCSKDDKGSVSETDIALARDDAYADALYDEVDNLVVAEMATLDNNDYATDALKSTSESVCYTVTVDHHDTTTYPKVVTIDFGAGCSVVFNGDTITRSGQVIITLTNRWFVQDAQQVMTFNNFYLNNTKIEGIRTITNLGVNNQNRPEIGVELENGKITFADNTYLTRTASHVRAWARQPNPLNDTVFITGTANGINTMGEDYNREITEPLVLVRCSAYQYRWVVAGGKVEITNSVHGIITIDYTGSGCTGNVVVNKNGNQYNYTFRYRYRNHNGSN